MSGRRFWLIRTFARRRSQQRIPESGHHFTDILDQSWIESRPGGVVVEPEELLETGADRKQFVREFFMDGGFARLVRRCP